MWHGVASPKAPGPLAGVGPNGRDEHRRTGWYRQAKETKCGGKDGRTSERLIVPWKQGNGNPAGPWGGKGTLSHGPVGRKHGECIGTRSRVNETTTDSGAGEAS